MDQSDLFREKYLKYKKKYLSLKQRGGAEPEKEKKSLYDRLGGIFAIAAVVEYFSDAIIDNPVVGKDSPNPDLRKWSRATSEARAQPALMGQGRAASDRLAGLKFMRTLWVCEVTGGPCKFSATVPGACHLSLEAAHERFHISPEEFDEVAKLLKEALIHYKVPQPEMDEVLSAFAAHKVEVTKGYFDKIGKPIDGSLICPHNKE